jgi:nitroimidazol reductase NimA-like FMN-containing flavoprotein (pyridoxamine 5'-phosphate oxidase superfamily)
MIESLAQIREMSNNENESLLRRVNFGHLGCSRDDRPYVIPIHFAYREPEIYFFTTEGQKTEFIDENPEVCLQIEDITDGNHWQSVVIQGTAVRLSDGDEADHAMKLIKATNPTLTPAWSIRWMDQWIRSNHEAVYRISPELITGRTTFNR